MGIATPFWGILPIGYGYRYKKAYCILGFVYLFIYLFTLLVWFL